MTSISSRAASGTAALNAMKRKAERLGRVALISSFVGVPGMFGGPFVCGLALGLAAASVVAMVGFLRIADRSASALLALAEEHCRDMADAGVDREVPQRGDVDDVHASQSARR